ncbi:hypothetical protein GCM10011366_18100 [Ornithinimicrobium tianjinense]|uniref:Uncharacterized protein n=2 Tax=Ornithinimicrobium tianjinense TaxID=1195761 RepID=A0A917BLB5_9MICO|nr:hypothetical protein GCM10011366_18100 [Ornithinimicrobium tianjinense]
MAVSRALLLDLVDDAAVFPPGNAPVERAWSEHLALRAGRYGDLLGPLLIGISGAASLVDVAAASPGGPVGVAVIARAGTAVTDLLSAVETLAASPWLTVVAVEVAHDADGDWRRALSLGVPVAVEVPRDPEAQRVALDEIAAAVEEASHPVLAKLRTQATAQAPAPSPDELAAFLVGTRERGLTFKLTGGLHHAVAGEDEHGFHHGVLNVLLATHDLSGGASAGAVAERLDVRDGRALAEIVRMLDAADVAAVRSRLASFGCCGVTDPLDELHELGIPEGA